MDEENPFKKPKSRPSGPQTSKNNAKVSMSPVEVNISHYVSITLDGSGKWLSKKDIVGKSMREETDPEVIEMTEKLRNTAVIVHQPLVVRPIQKDVRNFKKFKKVIDTFLKAEDFLKVGHFRSSRFTRRPVSFRERLLLKSLGLHEQHQNSGTTR